MDVLVAGGGPAGVAAAVTARAEGLEVALIDTGGRPTRPGESLPPGAADVLDALFGAGAFSRERHRPAYGNRSAWGGDSVELSEFMLNPLGHGWHLDRSAFDAELLAVAGAAGVLVCPDTRLVAAERRGGRWDVTLERSRKTAAALIDATGRPSRLARSEGARRVRLDHLVAAYWPTGGRDGDEGDSTTLVEAVGDGWWYTTPAPGGRRVIAYLTDSDLLPERAARTRAEWAARLGAAPRISETIGPLYGDPKIVDASVSYLDRLSGDGWIATGDAAVSFDPLSSQGIVTAVVMGREAGRAVATMVACRNAEPLVEYGERYGELLTEHWSLRSAYYGLERRWADAPFWARRVGAAVAAA